MANNNKGISLATKNKKDEFYTRYEDIQDQIEKHDLYRFKNKIVYCNCDDYTQSQFYAFFKDNFKKYGLKQLIATHYEENTRKHSIFDQNDSKFAHKATFDGITQIVSKLAGNGDFRSDECIKIAKKSDIIITNPPFSLMREYIKVLIDIESDFLIIAHQLIFGYAETFNFFRSGHLNKAYDFYRNVGFFMKPTNYEDFATDKEKIDDHIRVSGVCWVSSFYVDDVIHKPLALDMSFDEVDHVYLDQTIQNQKILNINRSKEIPYDYMEYMAVPITFLFKWNKSNHELIRIFGNPTIDGSNIFKRIVIKKKI